jgi:site-specific DNA recombinase
VVVVYCLDRLSRDPTHGVILTQELEKHGVKLEAVTEDVDNTELGKLISYIRGFASKLEAEKIRERTMRGKKAKAREGRISHGGFTKTYGYDYIPVRQENGGRRVINETEASWVRQIYQWLVNEGMSTTAITYRLISRGVQTKNGKQWCKQAVRLILTNPAYIGKTFAFTTANGRQFSKPRSEWIEIPDVTPAIISQELFDAAQKQLQTNRQKASRNMKYEYLMRGHLFCKLCGKSFRGWASGRHIEGQHKLVTRYRCAGKSKLEAPFNRCKSKSWRADKLEAIVWAELEHYLTKPELIISELEKQRQDANQLGVFEAELQQVERQLKTVDRDQHQLLQWALKGFPESQVETENRRLNKAREDLNAEKAELETQIKASQDATVSIPKLEQFVERIQSRIATLDFEGKRQVLDMLGIKVWLDSQNVEITGVLPVDDGVIVATQSG